MFDEKCRHRSALVASCLFTTSLFYGNFAIADAAANSNPLRLTGFLSAVGGAVVAREFPENYSGPDQIINEDCPCYVADWSNAGFYGNEFSAAEESRVGIQANYKFSPEASVTAQLVSRGTDATPNIQWAYASYKVNSTWEAQIGRKRIPMYYYSDFQDVGVSYPWVTPPPELYGWEATNYNGGSLRYNTQIAEANLTGSFFAGAETVNDSGYQKIYYSGDNQVKWDNLAGGDLEINYGVLTTRLVYVQAKVKTQIYDFDIDTQADLEAYGIAINLDFDTLFVVSEFTQLTRTFKADDYSYRAPALTIGSGLRLGQWTPFLNYAQYEEKTADLDKYAPQSFRRTSFSLRYDINSSSAVKAQVDRNIDITRNFTGNATVARLSYDYVFEL